MGNVVSYKPARSKPYRARQGYVDTLREVVLTRADISDPQRRTYKPKAEAYQIPDMAWELEGDKHTISTLGSLTIRFLKSDELFKFLTGLTNPAALHIDVTCYHLFFDEEKYPLWGGVLRDLPGGESSYPADKLELNFIAAPAKWPDADNVKDPETGAWYKNKHITDTILPALLAEAFKSIAGKSNLEEPRVYSAAPFFSSIDRPRKKLASPGAPNDETCRVMGMAWDSARHLLYVGVHDAQGSGTAPWLISYDPETRLWEKLGQFRYTGGNPDLKPPTEWEVCYLEYAAAGDDLYFVCRTNHPELLVAKAHAHIQGVLDAAAIPASISLTDAGYFPLHDRGFKIRGIAKYYDNRDPHGFPPSVEDVDYYADMNAVQAGWGTPRHTVKECGILYPSPRIVADTAAAPAYGSRTIHIRKDEDKRNHPAVGMTVEIHEAGRGFRQNLGLVMTIKDSGPGADSYFELTVEKPVGYWYPVGPEPIPDWHVLLYRPSVVPTENIFVAEPQDVSVRFLFPKDVGSPDAATLYCERRRSLVGGESHYWPRDIFQATADGKHLIDGVGFVAFTAVRDLAPYATDPTFIKYNSGECAGFDIQFKGYNAAYSLVDGLRVQSPIQASNSRRPGKCGLYHNGALVKTSEGHSLETYGSIWLWKDGNQVYVAWNEHGQDAYGHWYGRCCQGRWTGSLVTVDFRDRVGADWQATPERYITAYAHHKNRSYFGVKYRERAWTNTNMRIFWAAPPQDAHAPRMYDGGWAAIGGVRGDKTDVLKSGMLIRLGPHAAPGRKIYVIADVSSGERLINPSDKYLASGEKPGIIRMTWFTILELDAFIVGANSYNEQVGREIRGNYITIATGRDERAEVMIL